MICHTEASSGFGGQEIRTLSEATWLRKYGFDVLVVAQPGSRLLQEASRGGLPAAALAMGGSFDAAAFFRLRRLLRSHRVSLVHTHSSIDSWLGTLAARSLGIPVVRTRHVSIPIRRRRALVYRLADRVITPGEAVRRIVIGAGVPASKVVSIPAGVDLDRFHSGIAGDAVRREFQLTGNAVGLVANVRGSKGHRDFLAAAQLVLRTHPETRFLIVGDGIGLDDIRRHVALTGLTGHVILTGFRDDIPEVMASLDVVVLPSTRSEGIPQVIVQALAMAKPVVATDVGGIHEVVVDGETGILVPPGDVTSLAGAITSLLNDRARAQRLGHAGQTRVREACSMNRVMERTVSLYESFLAGGCGAPVFALPRGHGRDHADH
jgi:glycosyltransferase involved in cell wall biosynthesis